MPRTLPKTFTGEEVELLRGAPNLDCATGLRDRCVIELMLRCGLRVSEVCGLRLDDVDWRAGKIRLRKEITKGGRDGRPAVLDAKTLALLERWKYARRPYGARRPHLFVYVRQAQRGQPLTRRAVYVMIRRRAAKVGIERRVGPHMFRHTYATGLLDEGFTIREVQKALRHKDVRTTELYTEVNDTALNAKLRARS